MIGTGPNGSSNARVFFQCVCVCHNVRVSDYLRM